MAKTDKTLIAVVKYGMQLDDELYRSPFIRYCVHYYVIFSGICLFALVDY